MAYTKPFSPVLISAVTELIGINEDISQNDFGAEVGVSVKDAVGEPDKVSGEILSIILYSSETGTGAVQTPYGWLFIYDATPTVAAGDTAMTAAESLNVIGMVQINESDWETDATSGVAVKIVAIPFPAVETLYFAFKNEDVAINDGAGDDELVSMRFTYRRDS